MKIHKINYTANKIFSCFKVIMIIIVFIIVSTNLLGFSQDKADKILKTDETLKPDETLEPDELLKPNETLKPDEPSSVTALIFSPDNPIDRAFARIAEESEENLTDNVVFTYLYAVEWCHEYLFFLEELAEKAQSNYQGFQNWREILGFTEAENKNNPVLAAAFFNKLADFYKKMALDCYDSYVELGLGQEMPTDEDELYQYLQGIAMEETPFDYKRPDYKDIAHGFENEWRTKYPLPFQGELSGEEFSLSLAPPFGMVLRIQEERYFSPWQSGFMSVRWNFPQPVKGDYDGDGNDELAIIYETGTGSGMSVNELLIIEYEEDFRTHEVTFEIIENLLSSLVVAYYDQKAGTVMLRLDDQSVTGIMPMEEGERVAFRELNFSDVIYYEAADDSLKLHTVIKMETDPHVLDTPQVDFYADMEYVEAEHGSRIQLTNCRLAFDSVPQTSIQNGNSDQAEAPADRQDEASSAELAYFFTTDASIVTAPLKDYTGGTPDEAMTAYTELLKGKRGFYASDGCQYVNDGSNTLRDVFENFAAAYFKPGDREICDYAINYAIIDCGRDGNVELAVNIMNTPSNSLEIKDYTYILKYDDTDKTIKTIHFYDNWSRSQYNLYFYGYLTYHGSGGAASSLFRSELIDGKGQLNRIYSYNTDPQFDKETGQIMLDTAISIFGQDSETVAAFFNHSDPDEKEEVWWHDVWISPMLREYYIGDIKYLRFEYEYTESNEEYDLDFAAKTEKYNDLLAEQGINIMPPAKVGENEPTYTPNHPMIIAKLSEYADYITADPLEWHLLAYTTKKQ